MRKTVVHSSSVSRQDNFWYSSGNAQSGTVYPDSSFDVPGVPVVPGTNTLTATYTGPAFTNALMTATDTSTVVLGDTAYTHDANGNLTSDATFLYQYDLANQLTNVVRKADNSVILQCRYDALGRRVEAIRADGTVDRYIYFPGSFLVLAVLDETNAPQELYTRGPDLSGSLDAAGGIGGILACTYANGPVLFHHADLMGNVITLTDSSASLISILRYASFGQIIGIPSAIVPRYLFSSQEWEGETGLLYYGYRHNLPHLGRWMSRDPWDGRDEQKLYTYLDNAPTIHIDFLGLACSSDIAVPPNKPEKCGTCCTVTTPNDGIWWCVPRIKSYERTGGKQQYNSHSEHKANHPDNEDRSKKPECWNPSYCFEEPHCRSGWNEGPLVYYNGNTGQEAPKFDNGSYHGSGAPDHCNPNSGRICFEAQTRTRYLGHPPMKLARWCMKCLKIKPSR